MINKVLRCIHYKIYDESVWNLNITKWVLIVENLFKYEEGVFMYKLKNDILLVNFKFYFTNIHKIHNHLTISFQKNFFSKEM